MMHTIEKDLSFSLVIIFFWCYDFAKFAEAFDKKFLDVYVFLILLLFYVSRASIHDSKVFSSRFLFYFSIRFNLSLRQGLASSMIISESLFSILIVFSNRLSVPSRI